MAGGTPNVKHLWIQDPSGIGDPAAVNESTPEYPGSVGKVGNLKESAGVRTKVLQYVKRVATDTTVAAAAGALAYWQDDNDFVVCQDITLALGGSTAPIPAGVFLGTLPAAGSYGYIQVSGTASLRLAGSAGLSTALCKSIVAGDQLYADGSTATGSVISPIVGTTLTTTIAELVIRARPIVGVALAAQTVTTGGTVTALLDIPRNGW